MFDEIKINETEEIPILHKSGVYKLSCQECNMIYLGETGRRFQDRFREHARGEGNNTTNSLFARHFLETNHKFVNPLENFEILKIENDVEQRKLYEELNILKV